MCIWPEEAGWAIVFSLVEIKQVTNAIHVANMLVLCAPSGPGSCWCCVHHLGWVLLVLCAPSGPGSCWCCVHHLGRGLVGVVCTIWAGVLLVLCAPSGPGSCWCCVHHLGRGLVGVVCTIWAGVLYTSPLHLHWQRLWSHSPLTLNGAWKSVSLGGCRITECLLAYFYVVIVPHKMVKLERMSNYRGVRLQRFHCIDLHMYCSYWDWNTV